MTLGKPLPMSRVDGERIFALEAVLTKGIYSIEGLTLGGTPEDDEVLQATPSSGSVCLVLSSWGLQPGYIRIQLPPGKGGKK